jgi:hypothetical protein
MLCVSKQVYLYQTIIYWIVLFNCHCIFVVVAFSPLPSSVENNNGGGMFNSLHNNNNNINDCDEDNRVMMTNATVSSFTNELVFERDIPHLTPADAYNRCVRSFRDDNLGLPSFLPYPVIDNRGNESTGVGLVIRRSPLELKEGIVDCKINTATGIWILYYKVLNPSYTTFPVQDHLGTITLLPKDNNNNNTGDTSCVGCHLIWKVQWTPLSPSLLINLFVIPAIISIINSACNYVAKEDASN